MVKMSSCLLEACSRLRCSLSQTSRHSDSLLPRPLSQPSPADLRLIITVITAIILGETISILHQSTFTWRQHQVLLIQVLNPTQNNILKWKSHLHTNFFILSHFEQFVSLLSLWIQWWFHYHLVTESCCTQWKGHRHQTLGQFYRFMFCGNNT